MIAGCISQILLDAQVLLRRLDGLVPERELYLIDWCAALVCQLRKRPPQVVRGYAFLKKNWLTGSK